MTPGSSAATTMGLEFLARVQRTSWAAGLLIALGLVATAHADRAAGFGAGVAWSLVNLALLTWIIGGVVQPNPSARKALPRLAAGFAGTLAMFAVGAGLLMKLPPLALAAGFTLPFAVMVLKAASRSLLASPAWARLTRSAWTGIALLALAFGALWAGAVLMRPAVAVGEEHAAATTPATSNDNMQPITRTQEAHDIERSVEGAHAEDEGEKGPKLFPNLIGVIAEANHGQPWAKTLHHFEFVIFAMVVALIIALVALLATRNFEKIPGPLQNLVEMGVEGAYGFFVGILGPKYGPRLVPFLGTLFIYIWAMNFFGTIPFMHSPTANLNITVAMALVVFGYVQFTAFKELGFVGWLDHMAGQPRTPISWALVPLMLPVHLIGEIAKPISLSCRLFGNIFGEDMLLVGFATLGGTALAALHSPIGLPLQLPFMFLGVLITQPVQALVFTMLSTVYFLLVLPHDHGHGHGHGEEAHSHAH